MPSLRFVVFRIFNAFGGDDGISMKIIDPTGFLFF